MSTVEELKDQLVNAPESDPEKELVVDGLADFLQMKREPKEYLLNPILPRKGLAMVYGQRGRGKTFFCLSLALGVAIGGDCLVYQAPKPRRVLYFDGEMALHVMQDRLQQLLKGYGASKTLRDLDTNKQFQIYTPDRQQDTWANISTKEGRAGIEKKLADVDLVVFDNISCLAGGIAENEADEWKPIQEWLLSLRRKDICVLLVHHAGKSGGQRGTSGREDILDTVIRLAAPSEYDPEAGAQFEITYDKARGFYGKDAAPYLATLTSTANGDGLEWATRPLEDQRIEQVMKLVKETNPDTGRAWSIRDIAEELGMKKSTVANLRQRGMDKELNDNTDALKQGRDDEVNGKHEKERPSRRAKNKLIK